MWYIADLVWSYSLNFTLCYCCGLSWPHFTAVEQFCHQRCFPVLCGCVGAVGWLHESDRKCPGRSDAAMPQADKASVYLAVHGFDWFIQSVDVERQTLFVYKCRAFGSMREVAIKGSCVLFCFVFFVFCVCAKTAGLLTAGGWIRLRHVRVLWHFSSQSYRNLLILCSSASFWISFAFKRKTVLCLEDIEPVKVPTSLYANTTKNGVYLHPLNFSFCGSQISHLFAHSY